MFIVVIGKYKTRHILDVKNLSQFLMDSRHAHLVAKHAVRYLNVTIKYGLKYDTNQKTNLHGYVDSDW